MADKFTALHEANDETISDVISKTILDDKITAGIIKMATVSNSDLKEVMKVSLIKGVNKFLAEGTNVALQVNEDIFDELPDEQQVLAIKHSIHPINVNETSGAISLQAADLVTYSDFIEKIDVQDLVVLNASIESIKAKLKDNKEKTSANE